jgi:N-acetylneuraminate synthase
MAEVRIGNTLVGDGHPCYIIAEIGINHNGDIEIAKKLIDLAVVAGCSAVKFQKRTVDVVYTAEELDKSRESPFGDTNRDLKYGLEFEKPEYDVIDRYCREKKIPWFASCWDEGSIDFIAQYDVPCFKIASASLTDDELLRHYRRKGRPLIISTGMSKELVILHSCSTYPADYSELNLKVIPFFRERYGVPIGYSGHETGLASSVAAFAMGACAVERHITLERAMWGSDHAASLGTSGVIRLVRDIRLVEISMGDGVKRIYEREVPVMKKLRRKG